MRVVGRAVKLVDSKVGWKVDLKVVKRALKTAAMRVVGRALKLVDLKVG